MVGGMLDSVPGWLQKVVQGASCIAVLGLGALWAFQEKLLYVPRIPGVPSEYTLFPDQTQFDLIYEDVELTAADGTKLHCWHIHGRRGVTYPPGRRPVILFFQENAGNMSWRLPFITVLVGQLRCSVFVLGYRGYGQSEGKPSQAGLQMDSEAALQHVLQRNDVDPDRIVIYGKSLGGAVALHLAAAHTTQIRAAIVENTFTAVEHMVPSVFPVLAPLIGKRGILNCLVRNKWQNYRRVQELGDLPLMLIGSVKDELVPFAQMQELNSLKSTKVGTWLECEQGGHMDAYEACRTTYWPALVDFWNEHVIAT